jgi:hypothetical protein
MNTTLIPRWFLVLSFAAAATVCASAEVTINTSRELAAGDTSLDGEVLVIDGATLTVSGAHRFGGLRLIQGGVLTHPAGVAGLDLQVSGDVVIESGAAIDLTGRGHTSAGDAGPGAGVKQGWAGSGGGHGGWGGRSVTGGSGGGPYGLVQTPVALGSRGGDSDIGPGAAGGGALKLVVAGELRIDGRLAADGAGATVNNAGGGSGGSLWVSATRISGSGIISANGGVGEWVEGGGGGGGRIAVYGHAGEFAGTIRAYGAGGSGHGGAGTIFLQQAGQTIGDLLVSNGGVWGGLTELTSPKAFRVRITGNAVCYAEGALVLERLEVGPDAVLMQRPGQDRLEVRVAGDIEVAGSGVIHGDGSGYPVDGERGPGTGVRKNWGGSGGGHGGWGGASVTGAAGGQDYGSVLEPTTLGSQGGDSDAGGGAAGGGAIRLVVGGKLRVDGRLSVNGVAASQVNNSGGGAGGSLWLTVGTLAGTGTISADGGVGEWVDGGGGSGGRVALYYTADEFTGSLRAHGAGGSQRGGAGTVYLRQAGSAVGLLRLNNGDVAGAQTPLESPEPYRVVISGAAMVHPAGKLVLGDLTVESTAVLSSLPGLARVEIEVEEHLRVLEGGVLHADGCGYPVGEDRGPGAGVRKEWSGSGGGHGGWGGVSATGAAAGLHYGSVLEPTTFGSQGGDSDGGGGAAGGGAIRLIVGGRLQVDGRLSVNGLGAGRINNVGGGAGGSLWLTVGTLEGKGTISADGGIGEWVDGGGGSGGRVALYYGTDEFTGSLRAHGAGGSQWGGAGTVYLRKAGSAFGVLRLNNGDVAGAQTPLESPEAYQVVINGAAMVHPAGKLVLRDLTMESTAVLSALAVQSRGEIEVLNDLNVREGAVIHADGRGHPGDGSPGPGAGTATSWAGSGAGHGGAGGRSTTGGAGGLPYGSIREPVTPGSQGGAGDGGAGGAGGGAWRLVVGGRMQLDGRLSVDGLKGVPNNAGGGAGGSIWLTAGTLAGGGVLTANGGVGEWVDGGGGAGGRIALYLGRNDFSGILQARGAGGHAVGGSGTVYTRLGNETVGSLVVDNGGTAGTLTPLDVPSGTRLVLSGGTTVYPVRAQALESLVVKSGAVVTHTNGQSGLRLTVAGDLTLEAGARITAGGKGYPVDGDPGPGAGETGGTCGAGGAHGGNGGIAWPSDVLGGVGYGSVLEPVDFGSSGGSGDGAGNPRSPGGGAIRLLVQGTLRVDGDIDANGTSAWYNNQGGAAGGSIWINATRLEGAGSIQANGGTGEWVDGGGGGGGRVALYLGADAFEGSVQAFGGRPGYQGGGAGTVYRRIGDEPVGRLLVENGDVSGTYTRLVQEEALDLTIGRNAQAYVDSGLVVRRFEVATNAVLTHLKGDPYVNVVALEDMIIAGQVNVDGRGYPYLGYSGPGSGGQRDWGGSGAGHGGEGGVSATGMAGGPAYGSEMDPSMWGSQGGSGNGGAGGHGGGAIRLLCGGTMTVDGTLSANGLNGTANNSGGGSGGSILLGARTFTGGGSLKARGGAGEWIDGGGGAGGRIAVYRITESFGGTYDVSGAGGSALGGDGTLHRDVPDRMLWLSPAEGWVHGSIRAEVAVLLDAGGALVIDFDAIRDGVVTPIASVAADTTAGAVWDTAGVPDGLYAIRARVRRADGVVLSESSRVVSVNNAVVWHGGVMTGVETWDPARVHVVARDLTVASTARLTLPPGVVVKFLPGVRFRVEGGAEVTAAGEMEAPVTLTSFLDDTAGGDTNLDGSESRPVAGSWRFQVGAGSVVVRNEATRMRYQSQSYGGTLPGDEVWTGDSLHEIGEDLVVPAGVTLTLQAGALVKFAAGRGLNVQSGGTLTVAGSVAQPVVFTSIRDDAWGGDSNGDGSRSQPAAGDWRSLRFEDGAAATLDHAVIRYGGNSVGNPWGAGGAIEALGGPLTVRNSVIADALKDGAFCYGRTRFENCLVLRCDRGLTAVGEMDVVHCTVDECRIGLLEHVGQLNVRNTIVSRSIEVGIEHDLGGGSAVVTHCNVWNPAASRGNYRGLTDPTGSLGNISAEPLYKDPGTDNLRLRHASPCIDAAGGGHASARDYVGSPRYDDPRSPNTGTPVEGGAFADIGAFEFVESAPSTIDLVVVGVEGPGRVTAGELVRVTWTISNRGAEPFRGPWHDTVYLAPSGGGGVRLKAGEVLVGSTLVLGPGQSQRVEADVRVPAGVVGDYLWQVDANSRGDVFEGANSDNNQGVSTASAALDLAEIPVDGSPLSSAFLATEEGQWFRCSAPAGRDVLIRLDLGSDTGITEVYVGRGFVPTAVNFTARQREFGVADTSVVASGSGEPGTTNTFYVLALGRVLASAPASFEIRASTVPLRIDSVLQERVGNAGLVTLEILGTGFQPSTRFAVISGQTERLAGRVSLRQEGRAFATFDLRGMPAGPAAVAASTEGVGHTLPGAVKVIDGGAPEFYAELGGPSTTRAGRATTWTVTYGNRGVLDLRLPLLRFSAPGASSIELYESTLNWADSFAFLALDPDVLLPTLGPGREVTVEVRLKALGPVQVALDVLMGEQWMVNGGRFGWASLPMPAGANRDAWQAMLATLPARLGDTVAEYAGLLEADLDFIRSSPFRYAYLGNVNGRWLMGEESVGSPVEMPIIDVPPEWVAQDAAPSLHGAPSKIPGDGIRKTWWVIITMEDYSRSRQMGVGASDTAFVAADQQNMRTYARVDLRVPEEQIAGAHDDTNDVGTWTRENILSEIRKFQGKVDADDNLVVVYSGHGGRTDHGTGWLIANGGAVSPAAFTKAIDDVGAGTTYFINNSCHSEAFNEAVSPGNTKFVGFAATRKDRIAWSTSQGSPMITRFKGQLRKCRGLGLSFELTSTLVSHEYEKQAKEKHRQSPVLSNPSGASLEGKPWNDPSGFEQEMRRWLLSLPYQRWGESWLNIVGSVDPNDKYALAGAGPERWVQPGQQLPFEIVFENKTNAAAPAQEVLVVDQLDERFDWSSFELRTVAFNDARILVPPGLQRYTTTTRVGTDPHDVAVDIRFQPDTGRVEWRMWSVDPTTGDLPEDPYAGFLPPNDATHRGEGSLTYVIRPKPGLMDGEALTNRAVIVFDPTYGANPAILTPWVTNTIDGLPPVSAMASMPVEIEGATPVSWVGQDAAGGSGIASYDVYVSRDDGPYLPWLIATVNTSANFSGVPGSSYRFYSVARDAAGNTEAAPDTPDTRTRVLGGAESVAITREGAMLRITFTGILQSATALDGQWVDVPGASSPFVTHIMPGSARFFRSRQ